METSSPQNKGSRNTTTNTDQTTSIPNPPQSSPSSSSTTKEQVPPHYVRSYTCTFCEKGFSNAQALGGHMNIHRRDRARLRNMDDSELGTKHAAYTMISWNPTNHNHQRDPSARLLRLFDAGPSTEEVDLELRLGSPSSSSAPKGS